ncbi:MAG: uracil-DNA glycosylase [Clostridia bacterium]|nr:uracil-DNA glycosylase [Clostridia bacterium]
MRYAWETLYATLQGCKGCGLSAGRTNIVIGDGNPKAKIMLIGEGPGRDEDLQGIPFVGAAGKLLDKMLAAIDLDRNNVYIANIVKCRPPQNRTPLEEEAEACIGHLRAQVALVRPAIIVCLGATAARYVYDRNVRITRDRGIWKCSKGVWILPTYHPAALLRDESKKREAWDDLKKLRAKYEELYPESALKAD